MNNMHHHHQKFHHLFNPDFQPCNQHGGDRDNRGRGGRSGGRRDGRGSDRGQDRGRGQQPQRVSTSQYCHTHGACGHSSS